ncbi:MAG TPA: hypothetical protein VG821_11305 [Rhizomicrobium sp.]|jgi:hypothetical protein|nr:hypothetical protein [Rhizomicrobium sp.]
MKKILFAAAAVSLLATPAFADLAGELITAQTHAGLAAKATELDKVHMHLHHALNCLVGPSGDGFDPSNANPCAKQGNGAIPDAGNAAQTTKLNAAAATAKAGIANMDLAGAQAAATQTADAIGAAR